MTVKQRIKEYIEATNISTNSFERRAGLSTGYLRQLRKEPSREKIEKIIAAYPDLNLQWLLTGEGEMLIDKKAADADSEELDMVPLLPVSAIAGTLQGFSESVMLRDCRKIKSPVQGADWAIQISGDSMSPKLENGYYIYISKVSGSFIAWGQIYVLDTQDGVYVKKIMPADDDDSAILAVSINPAYPPFKINKSNIIGLYRILGGSFIISTM